ncbi:MULTISPECIES: hypothetical protein [Bacteria]|nr:hypothetical protein [Marinobacter vinifirmus]GMB10219.1 hypothetical protein B1no1_29290 [Thermolongibacillus altinsuensis]
MAGIKQMSENTQNLVSFIGSLPSAKNVRVYTQEQQQVMNLEGETAAVRRAVIRQRNSNQSKKLF